MISLQINIDGNNKIELVKAIQNGTIDITEYFKKNIDKNNNANVESIIQKASNLDSYPMNKRYQPKNKQELRALIKGLILAYGYNVNLNIIDTSLITDMSDLFSPIEQREGSYSDVIHGIYEKFNGDISQWNVSNVKNMSGMFYYNEDFNGDISNWDVSNVEDMSAMFCATKSFNGDLSKWNTSKVKNIAEMFNNSAFKNDSINHWNTSNIENFKYVFAYTDFNGRLDHWDVSNAIDMSFMFEKTPFNNDSIKNWDVRNVKNMDSMLCWTPFDKDLSNWRLDSIESCEYMLGRAWQVKEYPAIYMDHWMDNRINYLSSLSKKEKEKIKEIGVGEADPTNIPLWFNYLSSKKKKPKTIEKSKTVESIEFKYKERQKFAEDLKNILKR